jgi:hypothetical protein
MRTRAALAEQLEIAAAADDGDDEALLAGLRRAIAAVTRVRRGAGEDGLPILLDRIAALVGHGRAALVPQLVDVLCARLAAVDHVWRRVGAIHLDACRESGAGGPPLAADLFAREIERGWPCFAGASRSYADLLGGGGLAEYRRLCDAAWRRVPALRPDRRVPDDDAGLRRRLTAALDAFAEADGDLDARIAVRAKSLNSVAAYREIVELCRTHGRMVEALRWAEEGLWQFDGRPDPVLRRLADALREPRADREEAASPRSVNPLDHNEDGRVYRSRAIGKHSSRRGNARTPTAAARGRR